MSAQAWHVAFQPSRFLASVDLDRLIERSEAFQESRRDSAGEPCFYCRAEASRGIVLNDGSFLCEPCYVEVSRISFPERYEEQRRQFVKLREAHRLAFEALRAKHGREKALHPLVVLGWACAVAALVNVLFLAIAIPMVVVGYAKSVTDSDVATWHSIRADWEGRNPPPPEPALLHFHDPAAVLTQKDQLVLRIFEHWPGYPPFWKYLRSVVLARDGVRCQVTGCPSRLELHVHHVQSVSQGGRHRPDNLVSLCDFHHALEPDQGHERIWGEIRTRYFTLVRPHERSNRATDGAHRVAGHLRRLHLVDVQELASIAEFYGFGCPSCGAGLEFTCVRKDIVRIACVSCGATSDGPRQLTEETGPLLAETLTVTRNAGRWRARWDMLEQRRACTWGAWRGQTAALRRRQHRERLRTEPNTKQCPKCGAPLRLVRPKPGDRWRAFLGCSQWSVTGCRGSVTPD